MTIRFIGPLLCGGMLLIATNALAETWMPQVDHEAAWPVGYRRGKEGPPVGRRQ
jgi:hypothetical protein